jgi:predicted GNAT family acetyltransferase
MVQHEILRQSREAAPLPGRDVTCPEVRRTKMRLTIHPLTPDRWNDLVELFGPERGACAGCWCLWPRIRGVEFKAMDKAARRAAFRRIVERGPPPGLLAYAGGIAVGWVAVGPRASVKRFDTGKNSRLVEADAPDPERDWAITCFYVRSANRGEGLMTALARAAIAYARKNRARIVDVCPIEPTRTLIWGEAFVGIAPVFRPLGFVEVARRSPRRPLMRLNLRAESR